MEKAQEKGCQVRECRNAYECLKGLSLMFEMSLGYASVVPVPLHIKQAFLVSWGVPNAGFAGDPHTSWEALRQAVNGAFIRWYASHEATVLCPEKKTMGVGQCGRV